MKIFKNFKELFYNKNKKYFKEAEMENDKFFIKNVFRFFSGYNKNIILYLNFINLSHPDVKIPVLSNHLVFQFLYNLLPEKFFIKYPRIAIKKNENIKIIADYYKISTREAEYYEKLFNKKDIKKMKEEIKNHL